MRILRLVRAYPAVVATVVVLTVVLVLAAAGAAAPARGAAIAWAAAVVAWILVGMVRDLVRGHVGLDVLAVMAVAATVAVDEYVAALIVVLMLTGGRALEDFAQRRARRDLSALLDRSPRIAHVLAPAGGPEQEPRDAPVDEVEVGDVLLVRPGEIVPVDAVLLSGTATFDESSLTGESMPAERSMGEEVRSGAVNGTRAVRVRAVRRSADSQYQQIIALVHAAEQSRAPVVRLADRFAIPFTAVALALAAVAWGLSGDPTRFAEVLVLATPCPLLIAAPVAFLGGLSRAAKAGVIIKGGAVIEQLARVRSAAFDKTGTLTRGRPVLVAVVPAAGADELDVLMLAASAEQYSSHVFADSIRTAAIDRGLTLRTAAEATEVATHGVKAVIGDRAVVVGKPAYVASVAPETRPEPLGPGQAAAYVAVDGRYAGALVLADDPRPEAAEVIARLRRDGVRRIVMLTGDTAPTAASIGAAVGIDEIHAELLPGQKVQIAAGMQPRPMMMVGDGVNDAPVLAAADIGVAMSAKGATAAGDAADIVVLVDSLTKVVEAVAIGRHTLRVALTAIWIGIGLSIGLMLIATTGVIPAVVGALTQELVDLATILYALRALGGRTDSEGAPSARSTDGEPSLSPA